MYLYKLFFILPILRKFWSRVVRIASFSYFHIYGRWVILGQVKLFNGLRVHCRVGAPSRGQKYQRKATVKIRRNQQLRNFPLIRLLFVGLKNYLVGIQSNLYKIFKTNIVPFFTSIILSINIPVFSNLKDILKL